MLSAAAMALIRAAVLAGLLVVCTHVPSAQAATIRQLLEVVDIEVATVSPDGRLVAFRTEQASIERNTYDTVWYVQSIDGASPPRRLGEGGVPLRAGGLTLPERAIWSPDGRWIFYRAVLDGRVDVWRAAVDGSRTEAVTHDPANVRQFALSTDGSVLRYSVGASREDVVGAELAEHDRGIHIDRTVPLGQSLFRSAHHEGRLATQRLYDQGGLYYLPLLSQVPDRWKAIDLSSGTLSELPSPGGAVGTLASSDLRPEFAGAWTLAKDPGSGRIAMLTRTGDHDGLWERPFAALAMLPGRDARRAVKCVAAPCIDARITDLVWRRGHDEIVFTVTDRDRGHAQSIFRWNVVTGAVQPVIESRGQFGGGGRWLTAPGACAGSSDALVCVVAEADAPPRLERIDLESGERTLLFDPNRTLAGDMTESVRAHLLSWTDARGTAYTGQLFPAVAGGDVPPPLFIVYYACAGFLRGGVGDEWPLATLARSGISALCINAAPTRMDAVERYENGRHAVESVIDLLASRGEVDRARVGMGGLSMGAEVSLWTAMHSPVLRAVSLSSPVMTPALFNWFGLWEDVHYSRMHRAWQLGTVTETPERWRMISPAFDPGRVRVPVLMQLPEEEYGLSLDYVVAMIQAQQADAYVFPGEAHVKFQPRHKLAVYERNLDWFRFWLQDFEDADVAKADQYARWRVMRARGSVNPTP